HEMRDGVSLATRNQLQPIVLPTEIMSLPDLTGFLRLPQGFPVARFTIEPNTTPTKVKTFVERLDEPVQTGEVRKMPTIPEQNAVNTPPAAEENKPGNKPQPEPEKKPEQKPKPETEQQPDPDVPRETSDKDLYI
ncbi:MAG: type IV secretion system DNA-binding domain-containing protein, partial [Gammaproteobacteria bacterium]|nr:type IV secretion system DNA-binding domain-containing protein [Gammaproteobacteria bacterium]